MLRPGRIDRILYVGPPNLDSRREIFKIQLKKMACDPDVDIEEIAQKVKINWFEFIGFNPGYLE